MQRLPVKHPSHLIVGGGPVGSMLALLQTTLFPDREIDVFEKRHGDVRGHGLDIHAETVKEMNELLEAAEKNVAMHLKSEALKLDAVRRAHYIEVKRRIAITKKFLSSEISAKFIRTGKISEMAHDLAKELGGNRVNFHLDTEIKGQDILMLGNPAPRAEGAIPPLKQRKLEAADYIFAADGAHSNIRGVVFNEDNNDLRKNVLSYLLEIKLEMCDKEHVNKTLDLLQRQVLPTLKSGRLHIWNQSADGTATLHVFIDEQTYNALHIKDAEGKFLAEFVNPIRRVIDLPEKYRDYILSLITEVIDENKMDASTVKVTVLPLSVYIARKLLMTQGGKIICLSGDAGVGLALARGVNNGFYSAARYATALFNEQLIEEFNPQLKADFFTYTRFWQEQQTHLEQLLNVIDGTYPVRGVAPANRQIGILNQFDRVYDQVLKIRERDPADYKKKLQFLKEDFLKYLLSLEFIRLDANIDGLKKAVNTLFVNLEKHDQIRDMKAPELYKCQRDIFERSNRKIEDAKFEVKLLKKVAVAYASVSKDDDYEFAPRESPLSRELEVLYSALKHIDLLQYPQYSQWVFQLDRMYLELARKPESVALIEFVKVATTYVKNLPLVGPTASIEFRREASKYVNKNIAQKIVDSGNYLFSNARVVSRMNPQDIIQRAVAGVFQYIGNNGQHLSPLVRVLDGYKGQHRAQGYEILLKSGEDDLVKIAVIYALFNNKNAVNLREYVLKQVLDAEFASQIEKVPLTELDSQVMLEELQNILKAKLDTKEIRILREYGIAIMNDIENDKIRLVDVPARFKKMLAELGIMKQQSDPVIIETTITAINKHYQDLRVEAELSTFSKSSSFYSKSESISSMSFFEARKIADPEYLVFLRNPECATTSRLAVISALLHSKKTSEDLKGKILSAFAGPHYQLKASQVVELINARLCQGLNKEQQSTFNSSLYKLGVAMNDKNDLIKATRSLTELLQPQPVAALKPSL